MVMDVRSRLGHLGWMLSDGGFTTRELEAAVQDASTLAGSLLPRYLGAGARATAAEVAAAVGEVRAAANGLGELEAAWLRANPLLEEVGERIFWAGSNLVAAAVQAAEFIGAAPPAR